MTGRSNSATTSRRMWMLSASSARRWSRRRSVVTSGDRATVDIDPGIDELTNGRMDEFIGKVDRSINPSIRQSVDSSVSKKNPGTSPGLRSFSVSLGVSGSYPNSWTVSAGTPAVLIQQHAQGQQLEGNTARIVPQTGA